jgi:hypothetical protein
MSTTFLKILEKRYYIIKMTYCQVLKHVLFLKKIKQLQFVFCVENHMSLKM